MSAKLHYLCLMLAGVKCDLCDFSLSQCHKKSRNGGDVPILNSTRRAFLKPPGARPWKAGPSVIQQAESQETHPLPHCSEVGLEDLVNLESINI